MFGDLKSIKRIIKWEHSLGDKLYSYHVEDNDQSFDKIKQSNYFMYYKDWLESLGHKRAKDLKECMETWVNRNDTLQKIYKDLKNDIIFKNINTVNLAKEVLQLDSSSSNSSDGSKGSRNRIERNRFEHIIQVSERTKEWIRHMPYMSRLY